jgi:hypothetical protein
VQHETSHFMGGYHITKQGHKFCHNSSTFWIQMGNNVFTVQHADYFIDYGTENITYGDHIWLIWGRDYTS